MQLEVLEGLSLELNYTWSDFKYNSFDSPGGEFGGNRLPGIPEHYGNLQVNYRTADGFFLRWNTRFTGDFYADDANVDTIKAYAVSNLRMGIKRSFGDWAFEPFVGLNNVFDQSYSANIRINAFGGRYYEPAPGRNIYAGIRIRYDFK